MREQNIEDREMIPTELELEKVSASTSVESATEVSASVSEEESVTGGDVQGRGMIELEDVKINYEYSELHLPRGSERGLKLNIRSATKGTKVLNISRKKIQYKIDPNPHGDDHYQGHEEDFYKKLAIEAMKLVAEEIMDVAEDFDWPSRMRVYPRRFDAYTLER